MTCATTEKHRSKEYRNAFGTFLYRDVPMQAFGMEWQDLGRAGYACKMAGPEKAVCDMLYIRRPPVCGIRELKEMLFDDLRLDPDRFGALNRSLLQELAPLYRSSNHKAMVRYLGGVSRGRYVF